MLYTMLAALVVAAVPAMAALRDLYTCNPHRKDSRCASTPAFAGEAAFNFSFTSWDDAGLLDFWDIDASTLQDRGRLDFSDQGMSMAVSQPGDAPTLASRQYLLFGRVVAELEAAPGAGIVTAFTLKSDSGDEIDWELLGAHPHQAQSNYFYGGNALYNAFAQTHNLSGSATTQTRHTLAMDWSEREITLSVDGRVLRSWHPGSSIPASSWPQKPMRVVLGVWAVGPASDQGEVRWAGGLYPPALPASARIRSLRVVDLAGHCASPDGTSPVRYRYDERTWDWRHVRVWGCSFRDRGGLVFPNDTDPVDVDHAAAPSESCTAEHDNAAAAHASSLWLLATLLSFSWLLLI